FDRGEHVPRQANHRRGRAVAGARYDTRRARPLGVQERERNDDREQTHRHSEALQELAASSPSNGISETSTSFTAMSDPLLRLIRGRQVAGLMFFVCQYVTKRVIGAVVSLAAKMSPIPRCPPCPSRDAGRGAPSGAPSRRPRTESAASGSER